MKIYLFIFFIESLKKCPFSTTTTSAIGKARAFFRSLEFRHLGSSSNNQSISSRRCTTNNPPPSSSLIIDDSQTNHSLLSCKPVMAEKLIRIIPNNQDDERLTSSYFHQKYKQILKPSLVLPKQYYNDILNKQNQTYSIPIERHGEKERVI